MIENPKSNVIAICDKNNVRLQTIGNQFGIDKRFTNYQEMLESNLIDAVWVCTPTKTHSKIVIDSAGSGIHTFCEKPLASTLKEADVILKEVSKNKIKFTVGYNYRFLPNHIKARKYLKSQKIGKPIIIRGGVVTAGPYQSIFSPSKYPYETEKRIGAFFDLGSHLVDLFIWFIGKPKEVSATFSTHMEGISVDDTAIVTITFNSGVIGNISVIWLNFPNFQAIADSRKIEIIGSEGKIESDFYGPSLYFYNRSSLSSKLRGKIKITPGKFTPRIPDEAYKWSYKSEIDQFLKSILDNKTPSVTGEEAMENLKVILAAYESFRTKSLIKLE